MKALYTVGQTVPWSRVLREHRAALFPLAIVLALNVVVLLALVLPLSRSVRSSEQRVQAAERRQTAAQADFQQAEAMREGKARATRDLDMFYTQVLPSNVTVARRLLTLGLQVKAIAHDVTHRQTTADEQEIRDSQLRRLTMHTTLSGSYDDIRALLYDLETSREFLVIEKVVLAEGEDANAPLSVSLDISTYYRAPSSAVSTGANGR